MVKWYQQDNRVRRYIALVLLLVVILLAISGCGTEQGAATPEAAALSHVRQMGPPSSAFSRGRDVTIHGAYEVPVGTVVVYSKQRADTAASSLNLGYVLVEQRDGRWYPVEVNYSYQPQQPSLIVYEASPIVGKAEAGWIIYGRTLSDVVTAVEIILDTGPSVQDNVTDATFALVAPEGRIVCQIRALDARGQVLQQLDPLDVLTMTNKVDTQGCNRTHS